MKVVDILQQAKKPPISFEIIPPIRGGSIAQAMNLVESLVRLQPAFIDVTSHAAEAVYEELHDGSLKRVIKRKRPGTLGLCAAIRFRFGIETVPHLLCTGFSREETEDALIELHYLGIENVMALQGDNRGVAKPVRSDRTHNTFARDLTAQITDMNRGRYLEDNAGGASTDFCIGVAGYPERHFEAPNVAWDIEYVRQKVEAGAHYIVTQMFYDNAYYFDFVRRCREAGIEVPILPGLKIMTIKKHLYSLPRTFHIEIPEPLASSIHDAPKDQVANIGVEWAIKQGRELLAGGAPGLHFYVLQSAKAVTRVVETLRAEM